MPPRVPPGRAAAVFFAEAAGPLSSAFSAGCEDAEDDAAGTAEDDAAEDDAAEDDAACADESPVSL